MVGFSTTSGADELFAKVDRWTFQAVENIVDEMGPFSRVGLEADQPE